MGAGEEVVRNSEERKAEVTTLSTAAEVGLPNFGKLVFLSFSVEFEGCDGVVGTDS